MDGDFNALLEIAKEKKNSINLKGYNFNKPVFLLGLLSLYADNNLDFDDLTTTKTAANTYLERCGFFKYINHSIALNSRHERNTLFEITTINEHTHDKEKISKMDRLTTKLLKGLGMDKSSMTDLYQTFFRVMWELIDNVITHSQANFSNKGCLYMMQTYPKTGEIDLCIVDNGIGIKESFRNSSYYNKELGHEYYIDLAFQKGVTRDKEVGAGNGLYGTMEIIKATGSELIFYSGDTYLHQNGLDTKYYHGQGYRKGNILEIRFNINNLNKDIIENLISKGALAKGIEIDEIEHLKDLF